MAAELYYYDYEGGYSQTILGLGVKYTTDGWEAKGHYRYDIQAEEAYSYGADLDCSWMTTSLWVSNTHTIRTTMAASRQVSSPSR